MNNLICNYSIDCYYNYHVYRIESITDAAMQLSQQTPLTAIDNDSEYSLHIFYIGYYILTDNYLESLERLRLEERLSSLLGDRDLFNYNLNNISIMVLFNILEYYF